MTKPSIAILHYAAPPTVGGVETTIAAHARLFAEHGYPVRILAGAGKQLDSRVPVDIFQDVGSRSERVLRANAELARGTASRDFRDLVDGLVIELEKRLHAEPAPVTIIAHNVATLHKNLALTVALQRLVERGIPLIAWCHDLAWADPQYAHEMHPGFPWDLLREPWQGVQYVVVSEQRKKELLELWGLEKRVEVIPPGIEPLEFLGVGSKSSQWVLEHSLLMAAPLLLVPARLTRRKRIEYALQVTASLRAQGAAAKLIVTGPPGPHNPANDAYLQRLRSLRNSLGLEDAAFFLHELGGVSDEEMRDLYLLADALFFPSEREGFGIPILEAGLARLPIFCADLAPFHDSAGVRAHYFSLEQPPAQTASLIRQTLDRDSAYQLKRRVLEKFDWDRIFSEQIEPLL